MEQVILTSRLGGRGTTVSEGERGEGRGERGERGEGRVERGERGEGRGERGDKVLIVICSWPDLNAPMEVDTSHPLLLIVSDKDLLGHDFMGSWEVDMQVLMFLKDKYKKETITVLQRYSGLRRDKKEKQWLPIVAGVLEIVISF